MVIGRLYPNTSVDTSIGLSTLAVRAIGANPGPTGVAVGTTFNINNPRSINSWDGVTAFAWGLTTSLAVPSTTGVLHHNASTGALTAFYEYSEPHVCHLVGTTLWCSDNVSGGESYVART